MMNDYGFFRVAAAVPEVRVADTAANTVNICRMAEEAFGAGASLVVFPELSVTGYTCGDLFGQNRLIEDAERSVREIMDFSRGKDIVIVAGAPVRFRDRLYNCAVIIRNGNIKGIVPKIYLPSYDEFYETRWFASGRDFLTGEYCRGELLNNGKDCIRSGFCAEIRYAGFRCNISPNMLFTVGKATFAVEICEDLWSPVPPSSYHCLAGAQIVVNLAASNEALMKNEYRKELLRQQSARTVSGYVYCSAGFGESTQDLVYAGASAVYENGIELVEGERFAKGGSMTLADVDVERLSTLRRRSNTFCAVAPDGTASSSYAGVYSHVDLGEAADTDFLSSLRRHIESRPFIPSGADMDSRCREIISIQVSGLASRLMHIGCRCAVVGISGGLDSTLALLVAALAFDRAGLDRSGIIGITMPGYGTTDRTYNNALSLMKGLGVTSREISISEACDLHFRAIGHDKAVHDVTYENAQARERTQILMDVANEAGGIVVGTGDLSELALGWATYNGDHMSMYGVNAGVPKTLVRHIVRWIACSESMEMSAPGHSNVRNVLLDIVDTPVSPELLPAGKDGNISQKTEDLVGPYELHDFFLYNFFRFGYSPEKILFLAEKAFCIGPNPEYDVQTVKKWLSVFIRRFFTQQFKRSCMPDGPKVGSVSLSPRGDWRMPSDASFSGFMLKEYK